MARIQSESASATGGGAPSVALASAPIVGNSLVGFFGGNEGTDGSLLNPPDGTWGDPVYERLNSSGQTIRCWKKTSDGSEQTTIWLNDAGTAVTHAAVIEYGDDINFDQGVGQNGLAVAALDFGPFTPIVEAIIVGACSLANDADGFTGWTDGLTEFEVSPNARMSLADVESDAEIDTTLSWTSARNAAGIVVAFSLPGPKPIVGEMTAGSVRKGGVTGGIESAAQT